MFGHRASVVNAQDLRDPRVDDLIEKTDKSGFAVWAQMDGPPSTWVYEWGLGGNNVNTVFGGIVIPVDCTLRSLSLANDAPRILRVGLYVNRGGHWSGSYLSEVKTLNSRLAVTNISKALQRNEVVNFRTLAFTRPGSRLDATTKGGDLGSTITAWFTPR